MNKSKAPRLVTVAICTTITVVFWIFVGLYTIFTSKSQVEVDPKILEPLIPTLDTNALSQLEGKVFFEENGGIEPFLPSEKVSTQPEVEFDQPALEASESAEASPNPSVTP